MSLENAKRSEKETNRFMRTFIAEETERQRQAILSEIRSLRESADDLEKNIESVASARAIGVYAEKFAGRA